MAARPVRSRLGPVRTGTPGTERAIRTGSSPASCHPMRIRFPSETILTGAFVRAAVTPAQDRRSAALFPEKCCEEDHHRRLPGAAHGEVSHADRPGRGVSSVGRVPGRRVRFSGRRRPGKGGRGVSEADAKGCDTTPRPVLVPAPLHRFFQSHCDVLLTAIANNETGLRETRCPYFSSLLRPLSLNCML